MEETSTSVSLPLKRNSLKPDTHIFDVNIYADIYFIRHFKHIPALHAMNKFQELYRGIYSPQNNSKIRHYKIFCFVWFVNKHPY